MASKRTGRGSVLFGLLMLLAGLAGALVLFFLSGQRRDDAIKDLARAPVGCDTTLSFTDTGTFFVYVEHLGRLDSLDGDCESPDQYSRDPADEPQVTITLTDSSGNEVDLDRLDDEFTYSLDDSFAGTARRRVEIGSTGDYVVTVESDDGDDFVVAVGRKPADAANPMRLGAVAAGIGGVVLGIGLVLAGLRRARRGRRATTAHSARPEWPPGALPPTAPPLMQPPTTRPMPAPQSPGQWSAAAPAGPPIAPPGESATSDWYAPDPPTSGPFEPPWVFAPPRASDRATPPNPSATWAPDRYGDSGDGDGDVRDDASR
jgi:hypothetical protein